MELELDKIPCSWDEVTVQQYIDICNSQDKIKEDPLLFYSILFNISREELDQVQVYQFELAVSIVEQFKDSIISGEVKDSFEFEGVEYIIPKNLEIEKIGVYSDWTHLVEKMKDNIHDFIPGCLAMLCRPEGEVYTRAAAQKREADFHRLPITTAYVIAAFFFAEAERIRKKYGRVDADDYQPTIEDEITDSMLEGFGFYPTLYHMADGDIMEIERIRDNKTVAEVYYFLVYERQQKNLIDTIQELRKANGI